MQDYLKAHQTWLVDFYQQRNWYRFLPLIRLNFLSEELGELSRAVRTIELGRDHPGKKVKNDVEKRANLKEELADCFDQLLIICSKYEIEPEELMALSEAKFTKRFEND